MSASSVTDSSVRSEMILDIHDLRVEAVGHRDAPLIDSVSLRLHRGETLGLVGESGSGKSLTCSAALGLLPASLNVSGSIEVAGANLHSMSSRRLRQVRGTTAAMVFQEPMASLNPVLTIRTQLFEAIRGTDYKRRSDKHARATELLELVGINDPDRRLSQYPSELSGGMCQRIMIAIALAGNPDVLIADEPTTALDVTIQAQVLELLNDLCTRLNMALLMVTHDLAVVAETCDRVAVMYAGRIIETGPVQTVLNNPTHPYTEGLLRSLPSMDGPWRRLPSLPGAVPGIADMPRGCRFHPRCPLAEKRCSERRPPLDPVDDHTSVACWVRGGLR